MKKQKKLSLPGLFKKKYTEKKLNRKILKRIYIPADETFVKSLLVKGEDKKGRAVYHFDSGKLPDKKSVKRLKKLSKELRKQKGRLNILNLFVSIALVGILLFGIALFRNVLARKLLTATFENTFGAQCDIAYIDFNLLDTRFVINDLEQANRSKPMKNLFGVKHFEAYFDLLELSRGKFVCKNIEISGVTWNTDRTTSGELPPDSEKKYKKKTKEKKENPVTAKLTAEIDKIKNGVSVESGMTAIQDQLDPKAFIEREMDSLQSPAVLKSIEETVPGLVQSWKTSSQEAEKKVDSAVAAAKKIAAINPKKIKTVEELQALISDVDQAKKTIESTISMAKDISTNVTKDRDRVISLSRQAQSALEQDRKRLLNLVNTVKSFNLDTGKGLISDVMRTFIVSMFGEYYPYLDRGLTFLQDSQNRTETKKPTMKDKASLVERIDGRTIIFGKDSLPTLVFHDVVLSADDVHNDVHIAGEVQNISNDADKLDKPVTASLGTAHGDMSEKIEAVVDLRTDAETLLESRITAGKYPVSIPSRNIAGVPDISGNLAASGTFDVSGDKALDIDSKMRLDSAVLTVAPFEPVFVHKAYQRIVSGVTAIDFDVSVNVSPDGDFDVSVSSDIDSILYRELQKEIDRQIANLKKQIREEAESYIAGQKKRYTSQINSFTAVYDRVKSAEKEIRSYEKTADAKKAEIEQRIQEIAKEKAEEALSPVKEKVEDAAAPIKKDAEKALKKLF